MAVSKEQLKQAEAVGRQGGNVNTYGMSYPDKVKIDAAVRKGNGSGN